MGTLYLGSVVAKYLMLKKIIISPWTALITLALVVSLRVADPTFVESIRLRYFDTLVTSKPAEVIGVHVVNIDEKALEKYGQFPILISLEVIDDGHNSTLYANMIFKDTLSVFHKITMCCGSKNYVLKVEKKLYEFLF